jgi:hypothetical protein
LYFDADFGMAGPATGTCTGVGQQEEEEEEEEEVDDYFHLYFKRPIF